jgi:hypothetical protein
MPDLDFEVLKAQAVAHSASPQIALTLRIWQKRIGDAPLQEIHSVMLRCQIRLEPGRRRYSTAEQEKLVELYGEPRRWGQTVRATLWANIAVVATRFVEETTIDLPVPCTYDFNIATTKYFYALEEGEVPLCLLFSGTIFYAGEDGALQVGQISWEKETSYRMDVAVWKRMMELYYPNCAWLNLRRDVFDRLCQFKVRRGLTTWEQALEALLGEVPERTAL